MSGDACAEKNRARALDAQLLPPLIKRFERTFTRAMTSLTDSTNGDEALALDASLIMIGCIRNLIKTSQSPRQQCNGAQVHSCRARPRALPGSGWRGTVRALTQRYRADGAADAQCHHAHCHQDTGDRCRWLLCTGTRELCLQSALCGASMRCLPPRPYPLSDKPLPLSYPLPTVDLPTIVVESASEGRSLDS